MKKLLLVIAAVCMTTAVMAQSAAIDMMAGAKVGYGSMIGSVNFDDGDNQMDQTSTTPVMSFGAFFDATYVRAGLDYRMSAGDGKFDVKYGGDIADIMDDADGDIEDTTYSFLDISVLGKFPVDLGAAKVWGGAGFMYAYNISAQYDGEDIEDLEMSDFYVIAAVGADVAASSVFVCPQFTFGYNLTPNTSSEDLPDDTTAAGYLWELSLGVAMKI